MSTTRGHPTLHYMYEYFLRHSAASLHLGTLLFLQLCATHFTWLDICMYMYLYTMVVALPCPSLGLGAHSTRGYARGYRVVHPTEQSGSSQPSQNSTCQDENVFFVEFTDAFLCRNHSQTSKQLVEPRFSP